MHSHTANYSFIKHFSVVRLYVLCLCFWVVTLSMQDQAMCVESTTNHSVIHSDYGGVLHPIVLRGKSSGGTLVYTRTGRRNMDYIVITNSFGDSATIVALKLSDACKKLLGRHFSKYVSVNSGKLMLPGLFGADMLGGTERGFAIPPSPNSLSARYDPTNDSVKLMWQNPSVDYDKIIPSCDGRTLCVLPGNATSFVYSCMSKISFSDGVHDFNYCVVGYRHGVPSNAGVIHLAGNKQDELINIPFAWGVAPNWVAWSNNLNTAQIEFAQGVKPKVRMKKFFNTPDDKPFYQKISASGECFTCGTYRKFLGLVPGEEYKVSVRVNTFEMDSSTNWSFSIHAAYNGSGGMTLTADQLSGLSALPDGSDGEKAGMIAQYGKNITGGRWVLHSSKPHGTSEFIGHIKLPLNVDTITVWMRLKGCCVSVFNVGVDWVAVEKISENVVTDRPRSR